MTYVAVDLDRLAAARDVELDAALARLREVYQDVDARNARNTDGLSLPCHRGCDDCCHESLFLTELEFIAAWQHVQLHLAAEALDDMVRRGLEIYAAQRDLIEAFSLPEEDNAEQRPQLALRLRDTCPFLGAEGACQVYPARPLASRLFGCSFNDERGIYGCDLVGEHLGGRTVTLLPARGTLRRLAPLPLTGQRQVIPFFIQRLYG